MISQLSLYEENTPADKTVQEWGTFKDSLKAPVHRWFTYPAGFSYKAPFSSFNKTDDAIKFHLKIFEITDGPNADPIAVQANKTLVKILSGMMTAINADDRITAPVTIRDTFNELL